MTPRRAFAFAAAVLTAACALALVPVTGASAHPLGNFTVNRYDGLVAAPGELRVRHVEDLAEIPATQARPGIDGLGLAEWARRRCADAARDSEVTVDGRRVALSPGRGHARVRPGQAGLDTVRVECRMAAPLPGDAAVAVGFRAAGASSGPGWREITARGDRTTLTASDVPTASASRELTRYPEELLSSPADTATASLRVRPGGPALSDQARGEETSSERTSGEETSGDEGRPEQARDATGASAVLPLGADRFTRVLDSLLARRDLGAGLAALAVAVAVALGATHALAPGHGKTLMAATAAARGGRARPGDVLPLAASVTVTHTLGVLALGVLVTAGSAATPAVLAWLGLASGVLVTLAGATLVRRALRNRGHTHPHEHPHAHAHPHSEGHAHTHDDSHSQAHPQARSDARSGAHSHAQGHPHPPPTLRGTLLLGFAGGLVPSPSAVVVLVGAAALGHAWFGLLLVVAYGLGLALTLTAAGLAVVRLGGGVARLLNRRPRSGPLVALARRTVPLGSAFLVVAVGAGLVFRGAASALG